MRSSSLRTLQKKIIATLSLLALTSLEAHTSDTHTHDEETARTPIYNLFESFPGANNKWGPKTYGTGATVTWSLMETFLNTGVEAGISYALSSFMPLGFHSEIVRAFELWSSVANIEFVNVPEPGGSYSSPKGGESDIRIGGHQFDGKGGTLAHAFYPPPNGLSEAGDIHFDISESWKIGESGTGYDIFTVALHEIGHSIGLKHNNIPESTMYPYYTYNAANSLDLSDIHAVQFLYGATPRNTVPDSNKTLASLSLTLPLLHLFAIAFKIRTKRN